MTRIFLIGFMGSGKTTLARELAKSLDYQFVDTDVFIENRFRKSLSDFFLEVGEERFRCVEQGVLHELSGYERALIATGGGMPCFADNIEVMNACGTTIYLKASPETLVQRLARSRTLRPLLANLQPCDLLQAIAEKMAIREPFYSQATFTIGVDSLTADELVSEISCKIAQLKS